MVTFVVMVSGWPGALLEGDGAAVAVGVTGQMVVYSGIVSVTTWPLPGQLVTVGAQLVTV